MCPIDLFPLIAFHLSPLIAIHLSPSVAGCVRLYVCLQFICFPLQPSICLPVWLVVSALWMSPIDLSPLIAIHLSPSLAGGVRLSHVSNSFVSPYSNSFVSQCGWVCPALRMSPILCFPLQPFICLPVWLVVSALWMSPIHLSPLIAIHLSPRFAGSVRLSGCLHLICLPL